MNLTRAVIHTYNGQEAIAVGICAHLKKEDYIISNHRDMDIAWPRELI